MVFAIITATVIILAFLPIRLIYTLEKEPLINLKILIFDIKIKLKSKKQNKHRLQIQLLYSVYSALPFLLGGTKIIIQEFLFINVLDLAQKPFSVIFKITATSTLLAYIISLAKDVYFTSDKYFITDADKDTLPKAKIEAHVFLYRVIIFLFLVVYYKIKATVKRGLEKCKIIKWRI